MKYPFLCLGSLLGLILPAAATPENPLIPATWFQEITATDGSTQQCIIFTTVQGVEYTFYHSDALDTWAEAGKTYGLGHEFAASMRETAPAPPPPDPQNPPPAQPALGNASVTMQPSSDAGGGTVVSWPSLDHGNALQYLITGTMAPEWANVPIFSSPNGSHQFFVTHSAIPIAPPGDNPLLEAKDAAMIADLEAGLPVFNTEVATATSTARNTPPPPPPAPDSKGFWRIKADWSLDSDNDGILDHAEFAFAAANPAGPDGLAGNAFSADTNGDGIPDGEQLDSDGDGIPDAQDIAPSDNLVAYSKVSLPRYAMFEFGDGFDLPYDYQGIGRALAINDRGTVLFPDRVWKAGEFHTLVTETPGVPFQGEEPARLLARAINDQDQIIGSGSVDYTADGPFETICHWANPSALPEQVLTVAGNVTTYGEVLDYRYSRHLGNDGGFYARSLSIDYSSTEPAKADLGWRKWTLPAGGNPLSSVPAADFSKGTAPSGIVWGTEYDDSGGLNSSEITSPEPDVIPVDNPLNVLLQGNGNLVATTDSLIASTKVRKDGEWRVSPLLKDALDISDNGTAIRKFPKDGDPLPEAILLNGKWTSLARAVPGIPERWKTSPAAWLSDTSPGGWILAHDRPGGANPDDISAALLPLRVKGRYEPDPTNAPGVFVEKAVGVDDFSIGSNDPATSADNIDHVQDRIWIMAPHGGTPKEVVIDAPIHASAPLKISAPGILFSEQAEATVTARGQSIHVRADPATATGTEVLADLKIGTATSVSKPIGFKVMTLRQLKVTVWLVTSDRNPPNMSPSDPDYKPLLYPDFQPTKAQLDRYLNDIFAPQLNLEFDCGIEEVIVRFDTATGADYGAPPESIMAANRYLDTNNSLEHEFALIPSANNEETDSINVYIIGGVYLIRTHSWFPGLNQLLGGVLDGLTNKSKRICVIANGLRNTEAHFLDTIGHEIGHVILGDGHPDLADNLSPLPGTTHTERLMCSGHKRRKDGSSRLIVKREWDDAELWLTGEESRLNDPN